MNKRFSTLVVGLLLTTSFGAFAATVGSAVKQKDFKSGSTYFLTTATEALTVVEETKLLVKFLLTSLRTKLLIGSCRFLLMLLMLLLQRMV